MYVLNILRLLSPVVVLPLSLSLLTPPSPPPTELPGIRPIVTQRIIPRRLFILLLLCIISSLYLVDGAVFVVQTCLEKEWLGDTSTAWTVYSWGNVVVWAGTSVLVSWKSGYDRNGLVLLTLAGMIMECMILGFQARDVAHSKLCFTSHLLVWLLMTNRGLSVQTLHLHHPSPRYPRPENHPTPNTAMGHLIAHRHLSAGHAKRRNRNGPSSADERCGEWRRLRRCRFERVRTDHGSRNIRQFRQRCQERQVRWVSSSCRCHGDSS